MIFLLFIMQFFRPAADRLDFRLLKRTTRKLVAKRKRKKRVRRPKTNVCNVFVPTSTSIIRRRHVVAMFQRCFIFYLRYYNTCWYVQVRLLYAQLVKDVPGFSTMGFDYNRLGKKEQKKKNVLNRTSRQNDNIRFFSESVIRLLLDWHKINYVGITKGLLIL